MLTVIWAFLLLGCSGTGDLAAEKETELGLPPALKSDTIQFRPTLDQIPENNVVLRIHFSASVQLSGQDIDITDLDGRPIEGAMSRWIWDEKRRVVRMEPKGLTAGTRFAVRARGLVFDDEAPIPDFSKIFVVRTADTTAPNGTLLTLDGAPTPNGMEPLVLVFNEPVRWASLGALDVLAGGEPVPGTWTLGPHQTRATFQAESAWNDKQVYVAVGAGVSDLAGNAMENLPQGMMIPKGKKSTP